MQAWGRRSIPGRASCADARVSLSLSGPDLYNHKVNHEREGPDPGGGKISTELEINSDHQTQWCALSLNDLLDNGFIFFFLCMWRDILIVEHTFASLHFGYRKKGKKSEFWTGFGSLRIDSLSQVCILVLHCRWDGQQAVNRNTSPGHPWCSSTYIIK